MLSDTQISRLLDVANAACHGGNVVDARAMYAGVLALRPGFAPALMGKALSHIVVDDFDEAERLRERSWPPGCLKNSGKNRRLV